MTGVGGRSRVSGLECSVSGSKELDVRKKTRDPKREVQNIGLLVEGAIPLNKHGQKNWLSLSDNQLLQHARDFMKEKGISGRSQLQKADNGLYESLRTRKLLAKIDFEDKHRDWFSLGDDELIQYAREFMKKKEITGKYELENVDCGLYEVLRRRKLLAKVGFEQKQREKRNWSTMNNEQLIQHTQDFMKENGITGKRQLKKADPGLYNTLRKRNLLSKVGFEQKRREFRDWLSLTNDKLIQHAQAFIKEKGIIGRHELEKADRGLYNVLRQRKLIEKVGFEEKQRDWSSMSNNQIVQYSQEFMKEKGITGKAQLHKADLGLYQVLWKRDLLSLVFADIDQAKNKTLEAELVSGLRQAADAMERFGEDG